MGSASWKNHLQGGASLGVAIMATALTSSLGHHNTLPWVSPDERRCPARVPGHISIFAGLLGILGILAALWIDDRAGGSAASQHESEVPGAPARVPALTAEVPRTEAAFCS